jgi:hypothetical protein
MRFSASDAAVAVPPESKGTRAIASVDRARRPAAGPAPAAATPERKGIPALVWVLAALAALAAVFFALRRPA